MTIYDICQGCRRRGVDCDPDYEDTTCAAFDLLHGVGLYRMGHWIRHDTRLICSRCGYTIETPEDYCAHCGAFNRIILPQHNPLTDKEKM